MPIALFASVPGFLWHAVPLIAIVSLVYGATRHELLGPILTHSYRTAVWIIGFIAAIFAVLYCVSWLV